jgi:CRISPR-associated protein Cas2
MPMTVVVTRDVPDRFRGFLASCMLEIAPGVYTTPDMTRAVRERVWAVLFDWFSAMNQGGIVMTWPAPEAPGGQAVNLVGDPPKELFELDGIILVRRDLPEKLASSGSVKTE